MDGNKQTGSSSSFSFNPEVLASKDSSASSSSGIFGLIFPPSSKVPGRDSLISQSCANKQSSGSQVWGAKPRTTDFASRIGEDDVSLNIGNKDISSIFQEERIQHQFSSSIYYGGQDICPTPQNDHSSGNSTFINKGGEDDSGKVSRGNWWKGSLYY